MIFRGLDTNNDWLFGKGRSDYLQNQDAISANIATRLRSWRGDCFFATAEGVDYINFLDIGTQNLLDNDVRRVILQTEGVLRITSYTSTIGRDSRLFSAQADIVTIFGRITVAI